ncbi:CDP-glycerol--glycerophosphate glycerophosphotransferase, partial [Staphylococcus haemolyticus]
MQTIKQDGSILHIYFENPINKIEKLYIKNEFDSIDVEDTNGDLHFQIDLIEVAKQFIQYENKKLYIIVEESTPILTTQRNLKVTNNQSEVLDLTEVLIDADEDIKIQPYITRNGYLHLSLDEVDLNKTYFSRRHIDNIKINNTAAFIKGQFAILNSTLETVQLLIKTRLTDRETFVNINLEEIGKTKNASTYNFSVDIYKDLIEFMKYEYKNEDIIDIYLSIKVLE